MCQIENAQTLLGKDTSKDAKLTLLEKAIHIVDTHKMALGKVKNMSSLEKNRIALNLISSVRQKDTHYKSDKVKAIANNMRHQEEVSSKKLLNDRFSNTQFLSEQRQASESLQVTPLTNAMITTISNNKL